ncbi:MAG: hypothetical protein IKS04_00575, partial [Clostridia bacterium]|nr:hypothetical protein [Clostridia bacterium]
LEDVETALGESPQAKAVVITSPIYEGIISDIERIAQIVHSRGAKLIVDAAHGAHLGYSEYFPKDAISLGADISVESLHKTLPSLTQTAMLYAGGGIDADKIEYALDIFETSSPSYILMASIENCLDTIEKDGAEMFREYASILDEFYERSERLKALEVLDFKGTRRDRGKIVISCKKAEFCGPALAGILRKDYKIECEAAFPSYIICMTSICDRAEDLRALAGALEEIDSFLPPANSGKRPPAYPRPVIEMPLCVAAGKGGERIPLREAEGRISAEYLWAYPPGIPVIAPGEVITAGALEYIEFCRLAGVNLLIPGRESAAEISAAVK